MGDIKLGEIIAEKKPLMLTGQDRFGHMMIAGPTGCGKTSKIIKPCIWQDLLDIKSKRIKKEKLLLEHKIWQQRKIEKIKNDNRKNDAEKHGLIQEVLAKEPEIKDLQEYIAGLTVVEPKGDLAADVVEMCQALDLPYIYINPMDENTHKFNIMEGEPDIVAESTRTVLRNLFGKQEPFFAQVQETTARNTVLLMKRLRGDDIDIIDIARALRTQDVLQELVNELAAISSDTDDLVQFYRAEVFGVLQDRFYQFAMGLRQQLEDIGFNKYLQRVLIGRSDVNLDEHLAKGGILIVNTAMGELGKLGDVFGQFVVMYMQNAVFRRPGNEFTRPHHYMWIDEAPRYLNPDFERLLAIGRSYRCATTLAIQTLDQLKLEEKEAFAGVVLSNCRTKVIFGGLPARDAETFEAEFGSDLKRIKQHTYNYRRINPLPPLLPKTFRTTKQDEVRYTFTQIMELQSEGKKAEALVKYINKGAMQKPEKIMTHVGNYQKPKLYLMEEKKLEHYREAVAQNRLITPLDDLKLGAQLGREIFLPKWLHARSQEQSPQSELPPIPVEESSYCEPISEENAYQSNHFDADEPLVKISPKEEDNVVYLTPSESETVDVDEDGYKVYAFPVIAEEQAEEQESQEKKAPSENAEKTPAAKESNQSDVRRRPSPAEKKINASFRRPQPKEIPGEKEVDQEKKEEKKHQENHGGVTIEYRQEPREEEFF